MKHVAACFLATDLFAALILGCSASVAHAQATAPETCYAVSDSNGEAQDGRAGDLLVGIDRFDPDPATNETNIGPTGTFDIEAMALRPGTGILFAADAGQLGTIDLATGRFTPVGSGIGRGGGREGDVEFDDVDGLHFDPTSGTLYGSQREDPGDDVLLVIDPATGAFVPGAVAGDDYAVIEALPGLSDIDDLAIDPLDGQMYAIANQSGRRDRLVRVDKTTGAVTDVGPLGIDDVEGLSFDPQGQLVGTTGKVHDDEAIVDIDKATGRAGNVRALDNSDDYEGLACIAVPVAVVDVPVIDVSEEPPPPVEPPLVETPRQASAPAVPDVPVASPPAAIPELPRTGMPPTAALAGALLLLGGGGVASGGPRRRCP